MGQIANSSVWFVFIEKLMRAGYGLLGQAQVPIGEDEAANPKIVALAILSRCLSSAKGVTVLLRAGLIVEGRILARSCFECMFCICGLLTHGVDFVESMSDDDRTGKRMRGEFLLNNSEWLIGQDKEFEEKLRAQVSEIKNKWPQAKLLSPKQTALRSQVGPAYLFYSILSGDSGHCSLSALKRYLVMFEKNSEKRMGLDALPTPSEDEIADTLCMTCNAVVGVCVAMNQMLEIPAVNEQLKELFSEYAILSGGGANEADIAPAP
jgi:hypothetical protein